MRLFKGELLYLLVALMLTFCGVYLILEKKAVFGIDLLTREPTIYSGWFLNLIALVFFLVYRNTIPPFKRKK